MIFYEYGILSNPTAVANLVLSKLKKYLSMYILTFYWVVCFPFCALGCIIYASFCGRADY